MPQRIAYHRNSHFISYIELGIDSKVFEGVSRQKPMLHCFFALA